MRLTKFEKETIILFNESEEDAMYHNNIPWFENS